MFSPTIAGIDALLREPRPNGDTHVQLLVFDNGNPGPTMGRSPDLVGWSFSASTPLNCVTATTSVFDDQKSGNVVVHDAP